MKKLLLASVAATALASAPAAFANPKNNFSDTANASVDTIQSINDSTATSGNITGTNNASENAPDPEPPAPGGGLAAASLIGELFGGQVNDADSTAVQANVNESANREYLTNVNVGNTNLDTTELSETTENSSASAGIGGIWIGPADSESEGRPGRRGGGMSAAANNDSEASFTSIKTTDYSKTVNKDASSAYAYKGAAANNGGEANATVTRTDESDHSSATAGGFRGQIIASESDNGHGGGYGYSDGSAAANNNGQASADNSYLNESTTDGSNADASSGSVAANNAGIASLTATMSANETTATGSGVAIFASFGNDAVVSNSSLQSQVTGTSYALTFIPAPPATDDDDSDGSAGAALASAEGGSGNDYSLSTGENAFQNFAGLQAMNLNTGSNASQNANVSVSVASGSIAVGTTVTGGGGG